MEILAGTARGLFHVSESGKPAEVEGLSQRGIRHIEQVNGSLLAGADTGVYRSEDGGRTWRLAGVEGKMIWEIKSVPGDPRTVYAVTQPAGLYRSRDGGATWAEVESFLQTPGADRWCVPGTPPTPGRARTITFDVAGPDRFCVGVEVGGVVATSDGGATWTCSLPGGNPDLHVMVAHPAKVGLVFASTGFGRIDNSEPMEKRIAGMFRSRDGGATWTYLWQGVQPPYTRPLCIDPRPPYALTVCCSPTAFSSHKDEGGAKAMLYRSDDGGDTWRSLGDSAHSPSAAQLLSVASDAGTTGGVLTGTDTGEVWRVGPDASWTLVADGLPPVLSVRALV